MKDKMKYFWIHVLMSQVEEYNPSFEWCYNKFEEIESLISKLFTEVPFGNFCIKLETSDFTGYYNIFLGTRKDYRLSKFTGDNERLVYKSAYRIKRLLLDMQNVSGDYRCSLMYLPKDDFSNDWENYKEVGSICRVSVEDIINEILNVAPALNLYA